MKEKQPYLSLFLLTFSNGIPLSPHKSRVTKHCKTPLCYIEYTHEDVPTIVALGVMYMNMYTAINVML